MKHFFNLISSYLFVYLYIFREESQCSSDAAEELWKHLLMSCRAKQVQSFSVDLCPLSCCQLLSYYCIRPNYITKTKWKQQSTRPRHRKSSCMCDLTWLGWEVVWDLRQGKHSNVVRVLLGVARFIPGGSSLSSFSDVTPHVQSSLPPAARPLSATTRVLKSGLEFVKPDPEWESFEILHKEGAHCCNRNLRPIKKENLPAHIKAMAEETTALVSDVSLIWWGNKKSPKEL